MDSSSSIFDTINQVRKESAMSKFENFSDQNLPLSVLEICPEAQRALDENRVNRICKEFDIGKMREVTVSYRAGRRFVVDGQHGIAAAKLHYGNLASQIRIPCRVHEGLSVADDAELFLALNNQKAVSALDKYRVGVTKGIGPAFEVEQVISSLGLKVGANGGNVNAVAAVLSIHKTRGAEVLKRALAIAKESFSDPKDTSKFAGDLLHGIVMVICRKNSPVDDKDLIHSLRKTSATKLVHDARLLPTKNSARNMADTLVGQYNYQRSGAKRLPRFAD